MLVAGAVAGMQLLSCGLQKETCGWPGGAVGHSRLALEEMLKRYQREEFVSEAALYIENEQLTGLRRAVGQGPRRIPRLIHQTYKKPVLPSYLVRYVDSWRKQNPTWELRFYDDSTCLEFVKKEFPEYYDAYVGLPKDVERADFFRYMVLLRLGGTYADIDTECRVPLDDILLPTDTLVLGWENEFPTEAKAVKRHYVRTKQILQWVAVAAPGHPALRAVCDFINEHAHSRFSNNTNRDTLERTGPGAWTDVMLRFARDMLPVQEQVGEHNWGVRILPRISLGAHPKSQDGVAADAPEVEVLHHFVGSWKVRGGWSKANLLSRAWSGLARAAGLAAPPEAVDHLKALPTDLFPVSASFKPPFDVMVHLVGRDVEEGGADPSATISNYGVWQAGLAPTRHPNVAEALVGALGGRFRHETLVDVGAGLGFFSLAAASRGHRVHAFEMQALNARALANSTYRNSFGHAIRLYEQAAGNATGSECVDPARARDRHEERSLRRGYPSRALLEPPVPDGPGCALRIKRTTLDDALAGVEAVGALRLAVDGWEHEVLDGARGLLARTRPPIIFLEFSPAKMRRVGHRNPALFLDRLFRLGYTHMSHAGHVCDMRWGNLVRTLGRKNLPGNHSARPTWCTMGEEHFATIVDYAHPTFPENIIFHRPNGTSPPHSFTT